MHSEKPELVSVLKRLLAAEISVSDAQRRIEAFQMAEFSNVFVNLHHYFHDSDIRAKDAGYKSFQDSELRKLIEYLESGNIRAAENVSFLHVSTSV